MIAMSFLDVRIYYRYAFAAIILSALSSQFLISNISFAHFVAIVFAGLLVTDGAARERAYTDIFRPRQPSPKNSSNADSNNTFSVGAISVFTLELIGFLFVASWVYKLLESNEVVNSRSQLLSFFFILNVLSASIQMFSARKNLLTNFWPWTIVFTSWFGDMYEATTTDEEGEQLYFVRGAQTLADEFMKKYNKSKTGDDFIAPFIHFILYCIKRVRLNIQIQYFALHVFTINTIIALTLLHNHIWYVFTTMIGWVGGDPGIERYMTLEFFGLSSWVDGLSLATRVGLVIFTMSLSCIFYLVTTILEMHRQNRNVTEDGEVLLPTYRRTANMYEIFTQLIGNVALLWSAVFVLVFTYSESQSAFILLSLVASLVVALSMLFLGHAETSNSRATVARRARPTKARKD